MAAADDRRVEARLARRRARGTAPQPRTVPRPTDTAGTARRPAQSPGRSPRPGSIARTGGGRGPHPKSAAPALCYYPALMTVRRCRSAAGFSSWRRRPPGLTRSRRAIRRVAARGRDRQARRRRRARAARVAPVSAPASRALQPRGRDRRSIAERLKSFGLEPKTGVARTGVVAVLKGGGQARSWRCAPTWTGCRSRGSRRAVRQQGDRRSTTGRTSA